MVEGSGPGECQSGPDVRGRFQAGLWERGVDQHGSDVDFALSGEDTDTIVALATAPGRGGVGIVRVSGPASQVTSIARQVLHRELRPRHAHYLAFHDADGRVLDEGLALYFPGPRSFTGEDVLELQGHGGPVVLDSLLKAVLAQGGRLARPGEFSERAFLNGRLDLLQAEAIADLIDSSSAEAARSALRSLQGVFSQKIKALVEKLVALRVYVEASLDFPEEEIDFLSDSHIRTNLDDLMASLADVIKEARQGSILRDGMTVVIAGRPNSGKSSLLNALSGRDLAIVTSQAGTTRDFLREQIQIDGMPIHIVDTAGIRETDDEVERLGVERAFEQMGQADRILLVADGTVSQSTSPQALWPDFVDRLPEGCQLTVIRNKRDLTGEPAAIIDGHFPVVQLCAHSRSDIDMLRQHLKNCMGYTGSPGGGGFSARRRHMDALETARICLEQGNRQLAEAGAGELLAEDLRQVQQALGEITGEFSSDDLLGRIFGSFCIGK